MARSAVLRVAVVGLPVNRPTLPVSDDPRRTDAEPKQRLVGMARFGQREAEAQLRITTRFGDVDALLGLEHGGPVRMRAPINQRTLARIDGRTAPDRPAQRITHRFSAGSKAVPDSDGPADALDMMGARRVTRRTKFGVGK